MSLLVTDAVVLHGFPYLESSRILRLATREAGVQSVIAKGVRRARGASRLVLDLFVEGSAQLLVKPGRDLHTLAGFDLGRTRPGLASDLGRFAAASALGELMLRFVRDEPQPDLYETFTAALDALAEAPGDAAREVGVAGAWQVVATLGFAPATDRCARCHAEVPADAPLAFSHAAGGILCRPCGAGIGGRRLPPEARAALHAWVHGEPMTPSGDPAIGRAHVRLLREFLQEHLADGRPLRALSAWEQDAWASA